MVVESVAIIAVIAGAIAVATSTLGALAIFASPSISSSKDKYVVNDTEYHDRLRANYDQVYTFNTPGAYRRSFSRSSSTM
ncbi:unnamed protein product [Adineta steineri]|uniref:Uncharacterized protein n=1 Tax=Adineta steineri TaxID=433720 RepID=A0A818UNG9_9BILA|nr:unnamed protein product [Adineta steineri]CAF1268642.1 unnamed protein product [Adineta steineri]CAF1268802.1 unnamed protein product [Adineta steineri]CAF3655096.1 unnamed protein product [Adineta steineri]CAF3703710.1 unnamed protein product [Adineta steineri]